ncbi:Com family DNA-binding transcriptional regulator [Pseudomonas sp. PDNC002]|uniref:Com family DNA-binding transcriptional regulator n=1 Tax=Pseudomonas sp. PDNC002 TaxID=2811422 RepID=UPI00196616A9|nr:Com family DNA-binding transcriptional regulator [Pseudomonas sp. PDNC002]QRY77533.1 Com family DNA-binding transcriptional regulator [Pseudomonas sp. PDNC002]
MLKDCRCGKCSRLLARIGELSEVQIKCPRCRTLNHVRALSLVQTPLSDSRSINSEGKCEDL